jgi:hypothetical protein
MTCWKCGQTIELGPGARVANREACPRCDADLHCCRNCRLYDTSKNNQCSEPQAEWVRDKEAGNYCDYFSPANGPTPRRLSPRAAEAKKKFDSLFNI